MIAPLVTSGLGYGVAFLVTSSLSVGSVQGIGQLLTAGIGFGTISHIITRGLLGDIIQPLAFNTARYSPQPTIQQTVAPGSVEYANYTVFIGGTDRSSYVRIGQPVGPGISISNQINSRGTCSFTTLALTGAYVPQRDQEVLVYENGTTLLFRGTIERVTEKHVRGGAGNIIEAQVFCNEFGVICDRRDVGRYYTLRLGGLLSIIVSDIIRKDLVGTNITLVNNTTATTYIGDIAFPWITCTESFNLLAQKAVCDWHIDAAKNLRFFTRDEGYADAPTSFTDASLNWISITVTRTRTRYANRIVAKSSRNLGATWTDTLAGNGIGIYETQYGLPNKPIIFVNGIAQVVVELGQIHDLPYDFYFIENGLGVFYNQSHTQLSSSDTVTVNYPGLLPYVAIAENTAAIASYGRFTEIVEAGDVSTKVELQAIADAALERGVERPEEIEIKTRVGGFFPGQRVTVNVTHPVVNNTFIVESVNSQEIAQHWFEHTIKASSRQFQRTSSASRYMGDLIARSRTPIDRSISRITFSVAATIEGLDNPGLTAGVKTAIKQAPKAGTCGFVTLRFKAVDDGAELDTAVVIDIFQNGSSIFPEDDQLVFSPGDSEARRYDFRLDPLNVAEGDVFTFEVVEADPLAIDGILELVIYG